ncbi:hypothetical protein [Legionella parisiensis]|uniref:Uncharacterized protein n=1 Tax=Legionella parisiensis TaxID=45071 RepID=A0A1E5JWP0_9GAMM|nr:hypothetical protein [Legionella parisiensis]KTD44384.1 hypothetical protein Lpar_0470 [Legionella parisiensis]OEH48957.1 hypothetical protein lpari_00009 [Legionella parisiensis]STX72010.1 Uncharacterised protein [Legionella parisiensis]
MLIQTLEKAYPDYLSIKANKQFDSLVSIYSFELRAAYGYEWEKSKVEAANHPKFLEFMEELKKNGFLFKSEIKKIAPLLAQVGRTSRDSFFGKMPEDCLNGIASFLEPQLSLIDASTKMKNELQKAKDFYDTIRLFSYEESSIAFSQNTGTHVALTTYEPFKIWFAELPLRQSIPLNNKYGLYKVNDTTLAINSGPNTPGIQIQKRGDTFIVCNNLSADNAYNNMVSEESKQGRKNSLVTLLAELKQSLQTEHKKTQEAALEPQNEEKCSIQ